MFVSSTTYGSTFANWGAKPFERVKEISKKPFSLKFKAESSYQQAFKQSDSQRYSTATADDKEKEYDEKFKQELRKRGQ